MISFVEGEALEKRFFSLCSGTAFGCKLEAIARGYGFQRPFARFWVGERAAYCLLDGVLGAAGEAEEEEARAFIQTLAPLELFCPEGFAGQIGLKHGRTGPVLARQGKTAANSSWETPVSRWQELTEMHRVLGLAGMEGDFEAFYLDISHRLRHRVAYGVARYRQGRLAGCGLVPAVTNGEALRSALAVEPEFQGQGLGREIVKEICGTMGSRTVYVLREDGENVGFYEGLGFQYQGRWVSGAPE